MKSVEQVSTLIVGASMLGIGLAARMGRQAVVLESSNGVGNEFVRSFKLSDLPYTPSSESGMVLMEELYQRGAMDDRGRVHLPAVMPIVIKFITDRKLEVRMQTHVVDVTRRGGQYAVTCHDASGWRHFMAERLVDTSMCCVTNPERGKIKDKSLNMMLLGLPKSEELSAENACEYSLVQGRFPAETVLKFPVGPQDGWTEARNKLFQFWLNRPGAYRSCRFLTHADEFDRSYEAAIERIEQGWEWRPSAYYAHVLEAFDQGCQYELGGHA